MVLCRYRAKIFNWEGAQHSFPEQSAKMMKKLAAAGVGKRPVIFVAHSMGGLMVKEMMMQVRARTAKHTHTLSLSSLPLFLFLYVFR